jgi:hypothetical protein
MLAVGISPSVILSTSRTILDLTTKKLKGDGKTIFDRIKDLRSQGVITEPIAEWAHRLRQFGNDATHDGKGTREQAAELVAFIRFFLRATYELSAEIKEAAGRDIVDPA